MTLPRNQLGARTTALAALRDVSLRGKVAVVTGAGGLGTETARVLALAGADVVMACRNVAGAERIAGRLRAGLPAGAGALEVMALDLASLASVRAFARELAARHPRLHLLVNNAGVMATPLGQTADGFETQMGTNHLGHLLLTSLLLDGLRAAAPARVVVVASQAHRRGSREGVLATLEGIPTTGGGATARWWPTATPSWRTSSSRRRWPPAGGHRRHAVRAAPGRHRHRPDEAPAASAGGIFRAVGPLLLKSVEQGAATTVFAATAPELTEAHAGIYLPDCNEAQPRPVALDAELAERVWTLSERAVAEQS